MKNKRNIISLDVESALSLMQEIYNDIVAQKSNASLIMKKMLSFMKDSEDMSVIGPVIKEQQKLLNECTEKKISLVKLQSLLLKQTNGGNDKQSSQKMNLSEEDREILDKLLNNNDDNEDNILKYKL